MDRSQSFWQLAAIQVSASGMPVMQAGAKIASVHGVGAAILSVIIGNLLLWIIGISVISMAFAERQHSVENVKTYFGNWGARVVALILTFAFLIWIAIQLQATMDFSTPALKHFIEPAAWRKFLIAVSLGIALIAGGGIKWIKLICVSLFPVLAALLIIFLIMFWSTPVVKGTWGFSLQATTATIALTLPGTVNLPTFFRHSRSLIDGLLAMSIIAVGTGLWQIAGMCSSLLLPSQQVSLIADSHAITILLFSLVSLVCVNLVNIYFGCAGLDFLLRRPWQTKERIIFGLAGVLVFGALQIPRWMYFAETLFTSYLACLGIVLVIAFLIQTIVHHRPRRLEMSINTFAWGVGCLAATIGLAKDAASPNHALLVGTGYSAVTLVVVLFIEETIWCALNVHKKQKLRPPL